ncbi:MAG: hypothetical protein KC503_47605 [Myxococcales bacterium]|nr:hypothetical protein [Myxococcales bacterium]
MRFAGVVLALGVGVTGLSCAGQAGPGCTGPAPCAAEQGAGDTTIDGAPPPQYDTGQGDTLVGEGHLVSDAAGEAPPPDMNVGAWYPADRVDCATFCTGKGLTSVPSPDGCHCVSGESRCASALAAGIVFLYGCTGGPACMPQSNITSSSSGRFCYRPGQKQDGDDTDQTVACFCR